MAKIAVIGGKTQEESKAPELHYKEGELVLLTSGCYSSFNTLGLWRAKKDFEIHGIVKQWEETCCKKDPEWGDLNIISGKPYFEDFLVAADVIEKVECRNLHLGDYDKKEPADQGVGDV